MIGFFGDIVFETSDQKILTFSDFSRDSAARWNTHDVIGRKPTSEYVGPGLDSISFTVNLSGNHGVKPREEMEKWLMKENTGVAEILVIGNKVIGNDRWVVKSVSQAWNVVLNKGELFSGSIDIELEEYVEEL